MSQRYQSDEDFVPRIFICPSDSDRLLLRSRDSSSSTVTPASPPIPLLTQPQGLSIDEVLYELDKLFTKWERASERNDKPSLIEVLEEYVFIFSLGC